MVNNKNLAVGDENMYRKRVKQFTIDDFTLPFEGKLNPEHKLVKLLGMLDWELAERLYNQTVSNSRCNSCGVTRFHHSLLYL